MNTFLLEQNGVVPDAMITASSEFDDDHLALNCRMSNENAWCPSNLINSNEYLQIDFGKTMRITAVATKGHPSKSYWTETYYLNSTIDLITWDVIESVGEKVFR